MSLQDYSRIEARLSDKLGASGGGRLGLLARARELGLIDPEHRGEGIAGMPSVGRAMTKELVCTSGSPAAISERCGVEFDGWGTYVGPPHVDDGPGKPQVAPLFQLGEIVE